MEIKKNASTQPFANRPSKAGPLSRRRMLGAIAGASVVAAIRIEPARATPESMQAAIRNVVGEATVNKGRVQIEIPALVDNGNTVPLAVDVESPMTPADHVKAIHVFNELEPTAERHQRLFRAALGRAPS